MRLACGVGHTSQLERATGRKYQRGGVRPVLGDEEHAAETERRKEALGVEAAHKHAGLRCCGAGRKINSN